MFRLSLTRRISSVLGLVLLFTAPFALADEHGWREHAFREHEFRDHRFLDPRFHHDRYYPPRGFVFGALPPHYGLVIHGGVRLYFADGVWYRADAPGRYIVVAPPVGVLVPALPPYYTTVWVNGAPYYYANDVYYVQTPQGYAVTNPPPGNVVTEQPSAPPASAPPPNAVAQSSSAQLFIYPRQGQSPQQQETDRNACSQWAVSQTGFDPSRGAGATGSDQFAQKAADYNRAMGACLDGRGYTVK